MVQSRERKNFGKKKNVIFQTEDGQFEAGF